ncbi:MAG TPA: hypothetical protein DCE78_02445 [Bacteroidetes bacterium]|nr:hypothetical protein [Bacteroidota bacterium]
MVVQQHLWILKYVTIVEQQKHAMMVDKLMVGPVATMYLELLLRIIVYQMVVHIAGFKFILKGLG